MKLQTAKERKGIHHDSVLTGHVPSTGSMQTLPMTDHEKEEAGKKVKIVGFTSSQEDA